MTVVYQRQRLPGCTETHQKSPRKTSPKMKLIKYLIFMKEDWTIIEDFAITLIHVNRKPRKQKSKIVFTSRGNKKLCGVEKPS